MDYIAVIIFMGLLTLIALRIAKKMAPKRTENPMILSNEEVVQNIVKELESELLTTEEWEKLTAEQAE